MSATDAVSRCQAAKQSHIRKKALKCNVKCACLDAGQVELVAARCILWGAAAGAGAGRGWFEGPQALHRLPIRRVVQRGGL